nr:MAG TPA: putative tail component [Caudoviricetes sp.]
MDVKLTSHKEEAIEALNAAVLKALEECGLLGEGYAKKLCPVDTGRLRNSIAHTVREDEQAAYIGTNVEYAPHVELGTVRQRAQPYLKPAVADHAAQYKRIINKAMRGDA